MAYVRFSLLQPRPGQEAAAQRILDDLDSHLARSPGLLLSLVVTGDGDELGRVSVWRSKEEANREAISDHTLSLRSRLRQISVRSQEHLFELDGGHFRPGLESLVLLTEWPEATDDDWADSPYQVALPVD